MKRGTVDWDTGFTLVELLIAAAVSTVLVVAVTFVMAGGMKSFAYTSGAGAVELAHVQLVSARSQDIASAMPLGGLRFSGNQTRMAFPRLDSPVRSTNTVVIVQIVWEWQSNNRGIVRTVTWPDGASLSESFGRFSNFRFAYSGEGDDDSPIRTSVTDGGWQAEWAWKKFPAAVRVKADDLTLDVTVACAPGSEEDQ